MWSWLPDATSVLDFATAAIGLTLAGMALARKARRPEPPERGTSTGGRVDDQSPVEEEEGQ
jgi:hypothetical protein